MKLTSQLTSILAATIVMPSVAIAGSLEVSPVNIEVIAPASATVVRVRNLAKTPVVSQLRVFRWTQVGGVERLEPTVDVVASPPMATLAPGAQQTVRLIRINNSRAQSEDTFRLVVDEVPTASTPRSGTVAIVVRHSLPVFFRAPGNEQPVLNWKLEQSNGRDGLTVQNSGQRHIRLAALSLRDGNGQTVQVAAGLAGYVLAGSTMRFALPPTVRKLSTARLTVSAQSDVGPIDVILPKPSN